jgi:hypothetical protein
MMIARQRGEIDMMQYIQLVDALNTHNKTGSYEGCIIWKNAEANPLELTEYEVHNMPEITQEQQQAKHREVVRLRNKRTHPRKGANWRVCK